MGIKHFCIRSIVNFQLVFKISGNGRGVIIINGVFLRAIDRIVKGGKTLTNLVHCVVVKAFKFPKNLKPLRREK
jgi:hypothetical protein